MQKVRVLIGDSHVWTRRGVRVVLERHFGAVVVGEAADGYALVNVASRLMPTLVVLDLALPRVDGLQVIAQLRQCCRDVRFLVFTADTGERSIRAAFDAGASGYVLKQSPVRTLVEAAAAVSAGNAFVDPSVPLFRYSRRDSTDALTEREQRVVALVAAGYSNKEIASMLGVSLKTTETDRAHAVKKLGTRERADWLRHALQHGWFTQYVATI
jgi:two-component system response regulator NreC